MLLAGDERRHNNPDKAYVDADFLRGGGRVTANLTTLLTDFTTKTDQLKENVTTVYVISEQFVYRLKSIANIGSLTNGWKKETADLTAVNSRLDAVEANKASISDVTAGDAAVIAQLTGTAPVNAGTLGKLYTMLQGLQALINGDDLNLDSIKELADAIKAEQGTIDALTGSKLNKTDVYNALDYAIAGKALDARQGKALNDLITINATAIANLVTAVSNKVDKVVGKDLSTNDYTTAEKAKLSGIYKEYNLIFIAPYNSIGPEYFKAAAKIKSVLLFGANTFSYSIDNGLSYLTPTLPLPPDTYINIPAGRWVRWRITFSANSTNAAAYIEFV
jgi:hypothetical protein